MIVGVGIDLVAAERLEQEVARSGDAELESVLLPDEIAYCRRMRHPHPFYAARFAAKAAFFKALGASPPGERSWHDVEVVRDETGRPSLRLRGKAREAAGELGVRRIHVSLTHTDRLAAAAVVLET